MTTYEIILNYGMYHKKFSYLSSNSSKNTKKKKKKKLFAAFPWVVASPVPGGFMICVCLLYDGNS